MPAIVRSALFACLLAVALGADTHDDIIELVTSMAAALTEANPAQFMDGFDKSMPGYGTLQSKVAALVTQAEVSSHVEPLIESGNGDTYAVDLDWFLQVRSLSQDGPIVRRREVVHCDLRKIKKRWKIVSIKPLGLFDPMNPAP